jgi:RNA polymerase sigma factor (sigma-70 family)
MERMSVRGVPTVADHIDLANPCPEFVLQLDHDREAAIAGFQRFALHMFQVAPPPNYARVAQDDREDVVSEVIFHCIKDDCAKLRKFRPREGATFAGWFAVVASRKTWDLLRQERSKKTETTPADPADPESPLPSPEDRVLAREREGIFLAGLRRLERRCRLLLRLWHLGYKNREIVKLLRLPRNHNKKIGNQVIECREKLKKLVRDSGYFGAGHPEAG